MRPYLEAADLERRAIRSMLQGNLPVYIARLLEIQRVRRPADVVKPPQAAESSPRTNGHFNNSQ